MQAGHCYFLRVFLLLISESEKAQSGGFRSTRGEQATDTRYMIPLYSSEELPHWDFACGADGTTAFTSFTPPHPAVSPALQNPFHDPHSLITVLLFELDHQACHEKTWLIHDGSCGHVVLPVA